MNIFLKNNEQNESNISIINILNIFEKEATNNKYKIIFEINKNYYEDENEINSEFIKKIDEKKFTIRCDYNFLLINVLNLNIKFYEYEINNLEQAIQIHQIKQNIKNEICPKYSNTFNIFSKNLRINLKRIGENENFIITTLKFQMNLEIKNIKEKNNNKNYKYELIRFIKYFEKIHSDIIIQFIRIFLMKIGILKLLMKN